MLEHKRDGLKAFLCLLPAMIILAVFSFWPIIYSFAMSFMSGWNIILGEGIVFSGLTLSYYQGVLRDPVFYAALRNTAILVVVSVPLSIVIALGISVALNSIKRLQGFFQTIFFLPYVTNTIALGMVFSLLFRRDNGLINALLNLVGLTPVNWKFTGATYGAALTVLLTYTIWNALAFKILIFMSGLQSVDKQYYQAAQVDATPRWRVFWRITVPMISPMIAYVTITSFIGAFKSYTSVIAIFNGNFGPPGNPNMLITLVGYIYQYLSSTASVTLYPRAAAASVVLLLIILFFTVIQLYISKKRVYY